MDGSTPHANGGATPAGDLDTEASAARLRARPARPQDRVERPPLRELVRGRAGRYAVLYMAVAGAWIVASSWLVKLVPDSTDFEVAKGLVFVVVTAVVLFGVLVAHDRAAAESALTMRRLIESAGDVAFRFRVARPVGFEYISERIGDWLGLERDEFYGEEDLIVQLIHPDDRPSLAELFRTGRTPHSVPLRWIAPDGRMLHMLHDIREVLDRRGRIVAVDGRIRNVTGEQRSRAEAAIAEGILAGLSAADGPDAIAQHTCDQLVALMEIDWAWIGVPVDDGSVRVVAAAGGQRFADGLAVRWDDSPLGHGPAGVAIRDRRAVTMRPDQPGYAPWRQRESELGVTAALAVPLLRGTTAVGVMCVYSRFGNPFDPGHVDRFVRTAERLSMVMATARRLATDVPTWRRAARVAATFDVAAAIEQGRVEPWWQPQVSARDGRVVSLEALVRARTPSGEVVMPDVLLALAEEHGLMVPLGRALRRRVVEVTPRWLAAGVERVGVNASVGELTEPGFALELLTLLDEAHIDHSRFEVEVIETAPLDAPVVRSISELAKAGVRIAVDDYGSGWASLGHLAQLPAATLKIDRVFVRDIGTSERAAQLVRSTFELAAGLGLSTVAEGVETVEQARALQRMGCDLLQGYLFSRPMSTAETERLLTQPGLMGLRPITWTALLTDDESGSSR